MAIFILFGGLEVLFLAVAKSFTAVPVGGFSWTEHASPALKIITGLLTSGMELALRVSTPVLGIILVETLASGMVMKTMPQMNIMSIGFGLKVILGFGALILALHTIDEAVGGHIAEGARYLFAWPQAAGASAVGGRSGGEGCPMAEDIGDRTERQRNAGSSRRTRRVRSPRAPTSWPPSTSSSPRCCSGSSAPSRSRPAPN